MKPFEKLIQACQCGDCQVAKQAISDGADVSTGDGDYTALHWAAQEGHIDIIGLLLDNGADINSHDKEGFTPLQKAVAEDDLELLRYLIKRGADINDRCNGQGTALFTACAYGLVECTKFLLEAGADPKIMDDDGKLAEDYAKMYGHMQLVAIIKERSAQQSS